MKTTQGPQHGFALVTAMIFLVVLTLVAVSAMNNSVLELKMSTNQTMRTEALGAADSPRMVVSRLVDVHAYNRGWPISIGGTVNDAEFGYDIPAALTIVKDGSSPRKWYDTVTTPFADAVKVVDASYSSSIAAGAQTALDVHSSMAVVKLRADVTSGSGAAMVAGYEGTGRGMASGGGAMYFLVRSKGTSSGDDASRQASRTTSADYRSVIRN